MNYPWHRYLGPGNVINNGEPIDEDDRIAREHDEAYERALNDDDIRNADQEAIGEFLSLNSPHGYVGAAGLSLKYGVESLSGVLYPNMKRREPSEAQKKQREKYAKVQRGLAQTRRETGLSWRDIQNAHTRDAWNDLQGSNAGERPPGRDSAATSTSRPATADSSGQIDSPPAGVDSTNNDFSGIDSLFSDMENMDFENMQIAPIGTNQGPGQAGSGRSGGSNQRCRIVRIPRSLKPPPTSVKYYKNRIFFSYGYACQSISFQDDLYYTSPLALIPVDFIGNFLTEAEMNEMPNGTFAKRCRVVVRPLGIRTAFEFGGTTSGNTSNEFVAIGLSTIGLNINSTIANVTYTNADEMLPSATAPIDPQKIMDKYYVDTACNLTLVPRHAVGYACFVQPYNTEGKLKNNRGTKRNDELVDQFLINSCIGEPIVDYHYEFRNAPLNIPYTPFVNDNASRVFRGGPACRAVSADPVPVSTAVTTSHSNQVRTKEAADNLNHWLSTPGRTIQQSLEVPTYNVRTGQIPYRAQPQIHVGMAAVPAMKPSTDTTTFQNTSAYWSVECELEVEQHHGSHYSTGSAVSYPDNLHLYSYSHAYNGYPTFAGLQPEIAGVTGPPKQRDTADSHCSSESSIDAKPIECESAATSGPQTEHNGRKLERFHRLAI